jgi:hypothetical protein
MLAAGLFLLTQLPAQADVDTVVRDFDIDMPQGECLQTAIRLFQSLAEPGIPVRELRYIIYYKDASSELIAVCRADRGVLVLFTRGPLTGPAHIGIDRVLR